jgi:non-specific serine/threonine protein kinase/serine/threonine-protein kinase
MSSERWERTKQVLEEALQLAPESRPAFLDSACELDGDLRREVESLIASYEDAGTWFLAGAAPQMLDLSALENAPTSRTIDHYQLLKEIGRGGMGQVWLAEQTAPVKRQVALKLIRGGMYDDEILKRFEMERQSLAIMDHPSIAKVFDAGATPDGQPYFVMEYVPGVPITEYCDQKRLKIRERLKLFVKVCEGVQHAHQKAILHRDLKPANILVQEVDGKPLPRIIDFGLAKATSSRLTGESLHTQAGGFVGTPGYMSPEQCDPAAPEVDTSSDAYSLGVMLYVLLTGCLPFEPAAGKEQTIDELLRRVREDEPPSPSTKVLEDETTSSIRAEARSAEPQQLASLLRGDLDWITTKALEKDRSRRYGTALELAADVQRYLNHEPVMARPASLSYRVQKYIRRHRAGVAVAAGLAVLLVAFGTMQTIELRRITRERDRANRIAEFMTGVFKVSNPLEKVGETVTARELLDKGAKDIETGLAKDPELQAHMMEVMGDAYSHLGLYSRAESLLKKGIQASQSAGGPENRETLRLMQHLGWTLFQEGRLAEAESLNRRLLDLDRRVLGADDPDTFGATGDLATTLCEEGKCDEAIRISRELLEKQRRILGPEAFYTLATMDNMAIMLTKDGRSAEAEQVEKETLEIQLRRYGRENLGTIDSMINLADIERDLGRDEEATKLLREALDLEGRVLGPDVPETAETQYDLASVLARDGQVDEALALLSHAVDHGLPPLFADSMGNDPVLKALHGDPRFGALLAHAKQLAATKKTQ